MATIDTTRNFAAGNGFNFSALIARAAGALQGWNEARLTRLALERLSERELADIGLNRGQIEAVAARGVTY